MDGVGVDGCRGGWVAAAVKGGRVEWRLFGAFRDVLKAYPKTVIAVDVPIGLAPAGGQRTADVEARDWLARHDGQRSSVFTAPDVSHLELWRADVRHPVGRGVSIQAWSTLDKIAEVHDAGVKPGHRWVVEGHPEVSFRALPKSAVRAGKKTPDGSAERLAALTRLGWKLPRVDPPARGVIEDALDATALAWTALRHADGKSKSLPRKPSGRRDPRIVF